MGKYYGDFAQGNVVYIEDCTTDSTGLPSALTSGSACVKRMSDQVLGPGCTAITTSGGMLSLSVTTGSSATFYVKGDYSVYLGAGTAGGVIIIGYPLAQFSIGRFAALTLTTNVTQWNGGAVSNAATGIPKVDVDTIKTNAVVNGGTLTFPSNATLPSTTTTMSANVVQWQAANVSSAASGIPKVDVDTIKTNPVVNAGTITFPTNATLPSTVSTLSANVVLWQASAPNVLISGRVDANANAAIAATTVSANVLQISGAAVNTSAAQLGVNVVQWLTATPNALLSGRVDANAAAVTVSANVLSFSTAGATALENTVWDATLASHLNAGSTGAGLNSASSAGDPWNTVIPGAYGAGTAGKLLGNAINSSTFTMSANVTSINAVSTSPVTTIKAVQGLTTADTVALTSSYDFAKGTVAMAESYAADLAAMTPVQALHMIWGNASQFAITATSISVKKLDGTTEAMNFDLDSSTTPTLRNRNV